ncbi:diguanylate cyclase (GGDEF) domain-containing protein [Methylobacterium sp. ap11]|uniref:sensor domain-containing diguanylate cyclase n=1 Tax=Methylobacterium sp. ap11 TaxID=1761799 RepID=UPI0008C3A6F6|nr:sensor domain-containing diguanylate cyclase [Methylobacterium sp. ap11]SEP46208.1 diguanylate cyclase (GGDEF) domain-containing protein [Methylobacterium sp. ap11]
MLFDLAPTSLWLQDLAALKACLDGWKAGGMTDLRAWLSDPDHLLACQSRIRILRVNRRTLATYEARDEAELFAHIPAIFHDPHAAALVEVLCRLWDGETHVRLVTRNLTVTGRVIDVSYAGQMLPGHEADWGRYLISIEDITVREERRREEAASRRLLAADLFAHSPVPTLVRDDAALAGMLASLRAGGVADLPGHLAAHPAWLAAARTARTIVAANGPALALFGVADRDALAAHLAADQGEGAREAFAEELLDLWAGRDHRSRDVTLRHPDGRDLHLKVQASRLPDPDGTRRLVQVALTDIGDNKREEVRLETLGFTDPLTGLLNRAGYEAELDRLENDRAVPVSVIVADLNGLKTINDRRGHEAGDALIRRFGDLLAGHAPAGAARIGGDEFVLLLPATGPEAAQDLMRRILAALDAAAAASALAPSASLGFATWTGDGPLRAVVARADAQMYAAKRRRYAAAACPPEPPRPH